VCPFFGCRVCLSWCKCKKTKVELSKAKKEGEAKIRYSIGNLKDDNNLQSKIAAGAFSQTLKKIDEQKKLNLVNFGDEDREEASYDLNSSQSSNNFLLKRA
jgi:hypothetical protein